MISANIKVEIGVCGWILIIAAYIVVFLTLPFSVCACIKVSNFLIYFRLQYIRRDRKQDNERSKRDWKEARRKLKDAFKEI